VNEKEWPKEIQPGRIEEIFGINFLDSVWWHPLPSGCNREMVSLRQKESPSDPAHNSDQYGGVEKKVLSADK
jgi:hypothetical protein